MALVPGWLLLLTSHAVIVASDSDSSSQLTSPDKLDNRGKDCFLACWKTPGFCDFCGMGNACCRQGDDKNADASFPAECKGNLTYKANGKFHECVKAAFLPGQTPPASGSSTQVATTGAKAKSQCISYMAQTGCAWTNQYSCPGQVMGSKGQADIDDSDGFKCCCAGGLWQEDSTKSDRAPPPSVAKSGAATAAQCSSYMKTDGCDWTGSRNCPGQPAGTDGPAGNDGSVGYQCCCLNSMWQASAAAQTTLPPNYATAVSMDTNMGPAPTAAPAAAQAGVQPAPTAKPSDPDFMYNHDGPNVRSTKVARVSNAAFVATPHHGPIQNSYAGNDVTSKRERCVGGICADLQSEDMAYAAQPATSAGVQSQGPGSKTLPSYSVQLQGSMQKPSLNIQKITGATVSTVGANAATLGVPGAPAAAPTPAPVAVTAASAAAAAAAAGGPPALNAKMAGGPPALNAKMAGAGGPPALNAKLAAPAPAPVQLPQTTLLSDVQPGVALLPVQSNLGFQLGDTIMVGGMEKHTIAAGGAAGQINVSTPLLAAYKAGSAVQKIPAFAAKLAATGTQQTGSSSSSGGYGGFIGLLLICCCCIAGAGGAAYVLMGKKKKRKTTDREAYLKNDFIEKQPLNYNEVAGQQESDPMMNLGPPPMDNQLQPTQSFPVQNVEMSIPMAPPPPAPMAPMAPMAPPPPAPMAPIAPSLASFPGMPDIGGAAGGLLQNRNAVPTAGFQFGPPGVAQNGSMVVNAPYGNYQSPSAYMPTASVYSQQVGQMPVQYR